MQLAEVCRLVANLFLMVLKSIALFLDSLTLTSALSIVVEKAEVAS